MTTRTAEFLMAVTMAVFSAYLMWKSAELPIGWIPDEGPGGGFWPFWLSAIMLLSCVGILVNWVTRKSKPAQSNDTFITMPVLLNVGVVALALGVTIFLMGWAGTYVALFVFLLFYVGVLGRHGIVATLLIAIISPVVTFLFFEVLLAITLPKGITDPYFKPVFARVYKCPRRETRTERFKCYIDPTWK